MSTLHVELLTKAREFLVVGDETMICLALNHAANTDRDWEAVHEIKGHIHALLGDHAGLGSWLQARGYEPFDDRRKLKATRLAWIDWLIEEWRDAP